MVFTAWDVIVQISQLQKKIGSTYALYAFIFVSAVNFLLSKMIFSWLALVIARISLCLHPCLAWCWLNITHFGWNNFSRQIYESAIVLFCDRLECLGSFRKVNSSFFNECQILSEMFNFSNLKPLNYFTIDFKRCELLL